MQILSLIACGDSVNKPIFRRPISTVNRRERIHLDPVMSMNCVHVNFGFERYWEDRS